MRHSPRMTSGMNGAVIALLAISLAQVDYFDRDHFYFEAPGGQV